MKYSVKLVFSLLVVSLIGIWVAFSQTVIDPVDALFEQFDTAKALFEKNPTQTHQDLDDLQISLTSLKDPTLGAADLWHEIGRFYYDQNANYAKALVCFNKAWGIRQKRLANDPTHNDLARNQFMIGVVYEYLGYHDSALVHIQQAVNISEAGNNSFMLAKEYLELGNIFNKIGNFEQSVVYYERAYPYILKGQKDQANLLSQYFKRLASVYLAQNEHQKSIDYNLVALRIFKDSINPALANFFNAETGDCYINMNINYRTLNKPDSALFCIQQALISFKKAQIPNISIRVGNLYYEMAHLFLLQNKLSEAQQHYQKVIDILSKDSPNHPLLSVSYADIGEGLLRKNEPTQALAYFEKALKVLIPNMPTSVKDLTIVSDICLTAFAGIGRSQKAMGQPQKALFTFRQLDTLISDMRTSFKEDGSKFNLSKEALPIYENAIEAALTIGDTTAALDFCERNKAVVLREALQDVNAKQSLKIDPSVSAREKALRERISYYQKQRFDANDSLRGIWQDSIQRTKGALETLIKGLERAEPNYFVQKYAPIKTLPIADIQKNLPPEMLLLEYFMGDNQLFIFALSKTKIAVYPLTLNVLTQANAAALPLGFRDSITVFLQNIKNPSPDAVSLSRCASTSYTLYNWLLQKPLEDFNTNGQITRLRIVPDGILNYVPFDALIEQPTTDMKRRDVAFVLKKYAVSYIVSNQLLNTSSAPKSRWSFVQTIFGGFGINYQNTPLSKLPFAESEVAQLQYKLGGDAFTQTNKKALRTVFLEHASKYTILHLSMHGTVDDHEPMKSALQFVNEKDSLDPLAVIDVNNLQLTNNDLTVLSACNTGTGALQRGEGIMSLSRAFAQAGCRSLVMSLWTLQDTYTTEIISNFYDNLVKKQPKDVALAEAKRQFLMADQSERRAPNYWASLVVIGSVDKLDLDKASWKMWALIGCILLGIWYFWKKLYKMKIYLSILIFSFLSFPTFGKKIYTLSKEDFVKQFNDSSSLGRIYCHNEKGNKVWLFCNQNSILITKLNDNKQKKLMLTSIKYVLGEIQATEYNVWMPNRKINKYQINEIASFIIEGNNHEYERPYFNIDSLRILTAIKNDSIKRLYSIGDEHVIFLTLKNKRRKDTFLIMENACYNIKFKNNIETFQGVVQKITKDIISISSYFNQNVSNRYKNEFKIYHFLINDISEIKLLKTGGYSNRTIKIEDVPFVVIERKKEIKNSPIWYSFDSMLGEINFYRTLFTDGGYFSGIREKDGKTYWYEGDL